QDRPVATHGDAPDFGRSAVQWRAEWKERPDVPEPERPVFAGREERPAVRRKGDALDNLDARPRFADFLARGPAPQRDRAVAGPDRDDPAVGADGEASHGAIGLH